MPSFKMMMMMMMMINTTDALLHDDDGDNGDDDYSGRWTLGQLHFIQLWRKDSFFRPNLDI